MAKRSRTVEAKWRCEYDLCQHENPGPTHECEECNRPRPENVRFYVPKNARVITDTSELAKAKAGPDWRCMHCTYTNPATNKLYCGHCGTLRAPEDEEWFNMGGELYTGPARKQPPAPPDFSSGSAFNIRPQTAQKSIRPNVRRVALIGGGAIGVLALLFAFWYFVLDTTQVEVSVTGFAWERVIEIEKEQTVRREGWDLPVGARLISQEERQSGTRQVLDHYDEVAVPVYDNVQVGTREECEDVDLGNGYVRQDCQDVPVYERQQVGERMEKQPIYIDEPVYSTWYVYDIDEWHHERTKRSAGTDKNPYWPEYSTGYRERVAARYDSYVVTLISHDETQNLQHSLSENSWHALKDGDIFIANVNRLGVVLSIESP